MTVPVVVSFSYLFFIESYRTGTSADNADKQGDCSQASDGLMFIPADKNNILYSEK